MGLDCASAVPGAGQSDVMVMHSVHTQACSGGYIATRATVFSTDSRARVMCGGDFMAPYRWQ
jgi:hypothetical protein